MTEHELRRYIRAQRAEGLAAVRAMGDDVLASWGLDPAEIRRQEQRRRINSAARALTATFAQLARQIVPAVIAMRAAMVEHGITVEDLVLAGPEA